MLAQYVDIERNGKDPLGRFDNWLVGRLWYLDCYRVVETTPGISSMVIGAERPEQVGGYAAYLAMPRMEASLCRRALELFEAVPQECADIRLWPSREG